MCLFLLVSVNKLEYKLSENPWIYLVLVQQTKMWFFFFSPSLCLRKPWIQFKRTKNRKRGLNLRLSCVGGNSFVFLWFSAFNTMCFLASFCVNKSNHWKKEFVYPLITYHGIWVWCLICSFCSRCHSDVQCSQGLLKEKRISLLWEKTGSIWTEIWGCQIAVTLY